MLRLLAAALVLALGNGSAMAQPAQKPWPKEARAIYDAFKGQCRAGDGRFVPDKSYFASEVELNGDGRPDWIIEIAALDCHMTDLVRFGDNAPESGNASCGTAGCSVSVLISNRQGFQTAELGNVRGWSVVDVGNGRKGLELSVHGTACGGFGAEVCLSTVTWTGREWRQLNMRKPSDAEIEASLEANQAEAASYQEPFRHETRWQTVGSGPGTMAVLLDHPEFAPLGLRCRPGGGIFLTVVARPQSPLPPQGQPLLLDFHGSTEGIRATQSLNKDAAANEWSGPLVPPLHALLSGRDEGLELLASVDGGQEWTVLTYLSNAGSTAALRTLESACASAAGAQATTEARGMQPVGPLGIVAGYYVAESEPCSDPGPNGAFFYDGRRFGLMNGGGSDPWDENVVEALGSVRKQGRSFAMEGWDIEMEIISPSRIRATIQDTGPVMRWCAADQVPANYRAR